jgi:hypothetical protein
MKSSIFKFFLFAIIVQCFHSAEVAKNNSNLSLQFLENIIREQQAESDLEKQQQQQQRGPASYLDKAMTSASTGSESDATPTKVEKVAAKLNINEETTSAVQVS